ncbi:hypothetical protein GS506_14805 [Rhodococcus hoagii]|nr:hypothetical protein [Prescottella equi]
MEIRLSRHKDGQRRRAIRAHVCRRSKASESRAAIPCHTFSAATGPHPASYPEGDDNGRNVCVCADSASSRPS